MAAQVLACKRHVHHVGFCFAGHFDHFHPKVADQLLLGGFDATVLELEGLIRLVPLNRLPGFGEIFSLDNPCRHITRKLDVEVFERELVLVGRLDLFTVHLLYSVLGDT